ncbi:WhiB family transcriptional regulator [Streptomyces sp. NBC_00572]|uniref:WhiB family transcriptional regulator n=1 Tax=Streptomyces sp. NBC_00572 TaxID=2903664 RepID=UPI00224FB0A3|nr:WhiB family transcriptional regulator [Streptomyces sp. NBC_00572]MCX4987152.1 WhiB family transcriptional regulator [Streptomyces sp. NBC_00572]
MNSLTINTGWRRAAACTDMAVDAFFPAAADAEGRREALAICEPCPVREECLAEALAEEGGRGKTGRFGIRGGRTASGRYNLYNAAKKAQRAALAVEAAA